MAKLISVSVLAETSFRYILDISDGTVVLNTMLTLVSRHPSKFVVQRKANAANGCAEKWVEQLK